MPRNEGSLHPDFYSCIEIYRTHGAHCSYVGTGSSQFVGKFRLLQPIPLERWTKLEDLGAAAAFFASEDSIRITSEHVVGSGGLSGVSGIAPRRKPASQVQVTSNMLA